MRQKPCMAAGGTILPFRRRITIMTSVDMWGTQRVAGKPRSQFIYVDGEPNRSTVVEAIKAGHLMPAIYIREADISLDGRMPGDSLSLTEAQNGSLHIQLEAEKPLSELRLFSFDQLIFREDLHGATSLKRTISLKGMPLRSFIRLEITGPEAAIFSNPFYLDPA